MCTASDAPGAARNRVTLVPVQAQLFYMLVGDFSSIWALEGNVTSTPFGGVVAVAPIPRTSLFSAGGNHSHFFYPFDELL